MGGPDRVSSCRKILELEEPIRIRRGRTEDSVPDRIPKFDRNTLDAGLTRLLHPITIAVAPDTVTDRRRALLVAEVYRVDQPARTQRDLRRTHRRDPVPVKRCHPTRRHTHRDGVGARRKIQEAVIAIGIRRRRRPRRERHRGSYDPRLARVLDAVRVGIRPHPITHPPARVPKVHVAPDFLGSQDNLGLIGRACTVKIRGRLIPGRGQDHHEVVARGQPGESIETIGIRHRRTHERLVNRQPKLHSHPSQTRFRCVLDAIGVAVLPNPVTNGGISRLETEVDRVDHFTGIQSHLRRRRRFHPVCIPGSHIPGRLTDDGNRVGPSNQAPEAIGAIDVRRHGRDHRTG